MHRSVKRILTTHVGSLPRARELSDLLIAQEAGQRVDGARLDALAAAGVRECVARQISAGLDVINDGEQPRVGFQTYVAQRLSGFGGVSERLPFTDFAHYPDFAQVWANRGMVMSKAYVHNIRSAANKAARALMAKEGKKTVKGNKAKLESQFRELVISLGPSRAKKLLSQVETSLAISASK